MRQSPAGEDQAGELSGSMARLFFALWPAPPVRDALARWVASEPVAAPGIQPTRADNLHLTLGFLGTVPRERLHGVLAAAAGVRAHPFSMRLDQLEHWAGPAIYCLTPSVVPDGLPALAAQLRAALHARGLPADERAYRPHVTLCRKARGPEAAAGSAPTPVAGINWQAEEFVLAESADDTGRSVYGIVGRWGLGA